MMYKYQPLRNPQNFYRSDNYSFLRKYSSKPTKRQLEECYKLLNVSKESKQNDIRQAFITLAKLYHPDSGSPEASIEKFVAVENAFRTLTKHNTGLNNTEEVEKIVFDIKHTAPQHRQYLTFEGYGHGNPYQREKQWQQARAQRAAINVMEHRIQSTIASDKTLMKKEQHQRKHDIKTKYGFDRIVEDMIQESMSKGEFENLSGKGKPLKDQNPNPYVDFTTHKLNEVLINNGFTPEWITLIKEIDEDIQALRDQIADERMYLGPFPLNVQDTEKWEKIYHLNKDVVKCINNKINTYNLIVPLLNKQKFHVKFDDICCDILKNGKHSQIRLHPKYNEHRKVENNHPVNADDGDVFSLLFKAICEVFSLQKDKKKLNS